MKRPLVLTLSLLALLGSAEAGRRSSGGGFGGSSRSSSPSRSYSSPSRSTPSYSAPSRPAPSRPPSYSPPANSSSGSAYTRPRSVPVTPKPKLSKPAPPRSAPTSSSSSTPAPNRAPVPSVSQSQLNAWKSAPLPAGVPRRALTYQTSPSGDYRYQLETGRYYPYPQSYYRQHSIGYDLLKYALIFTAVSSVADALDGPDMVVNNVQNADFGNELQGVNYTNAAAPAPAGLNLWPYVGVGLLAAAAAWFIFGRKR